MTHEASHVLTFLQDVAGYTQAQLHAGSADRPVKLATIDPTYNPETFAAGTLPRITYDGETVLTTKRYPVVGMYWPQPGDRVVMLPAGHTYAILGAVSSYPRAVGYLLKQTVVFTASGSFTKASYPGLRAVRVRCQAAGGGGAAAVTTAGGTTSAGNGGGAGGYAEAFAVASDLATTEAVTVGTGGAGGTTGAGSAGGDSALDTISGEVRATGGAGGATLAAQSAAVSNTSRSDGGIGTAGSVLLRGGYGGPAMTLSSSRSRGGDGGASHLGGAMPGIGSGGTNNTGTTGANYGGGGSGAANANSQSATAGGAGAPGIVIVEVYV
jgi:hypothetical protein